MDEGFSGRERHATPPPSRPAKPLRIGARIHHGIDPSENETGDGRAMTIARFKFTSH
jgi:hypothetical protein